MNVVWFILIALAVLIGALTGTMQGVTDAAMDSAKVAVELAIGLIGVMALWLGLMKIAEESGLVRSLAKLLRPILIKIFPEVPPDHPAMGSMVMNIAANMLGLGNSATALGLKAMKDLQELNTEKDSASNPMATFLAINTSSVTIVPATVIALRVASGSTAPAEIIGPAILATAVSTIVGILAAKFYQRFSKPQGVAASVEVKSTEAGGTDDE